LREERRAQDSIKSGERGVLTIFYEVGGPPALWAGLPLYPLSRRQEEGRRKAGGRQEESRRKAGGRQEESRRKAR